MKNQVLEILEKKAQEIKLARQYNSIKDLELIIAEFRGMYQMAINLGIKEESLNAIVQIAK